MTRRRSVLGAVAALGAAGVAGADTADAQPGNDADCALADLEVESKREKWLRARLHEHYGSHFHKPPSRGIYYHWMDRGVRVAQRAAIVPRVQIMCELETPRYSRDAWDCEDESLAARQRLLQAWPWLTVGVAYNHAGDHAWLVVPTSEGDIVEIEPQTGAVVGDDAPRRYDFTEGVLQI